MPDSRLLRRFLITALFVFAPGLLTAPAEAQFVEFHVDTTDDLQDDTPGDGACETIVDGTAVCSLRGAFEETNYQFGPRGSADSADIIVPEGTYGLTLGRLEMVRGGTLRILGAGADTTFIGPEDLDTSSHGVLQFDDRMTLHVEGVTIQHGNAASGGGINFNQIVVLTLLDSHIRLNQAQRGTAINFNQDTTFTIRGTTISENVDTSLSGKAGAIAFNNFGRGALINTTIVGNEGQSAVALFSNNRSEIELVNSTIAGSVATPGSSLVSQIDFQNASALTLLNSIVVAPAGVVCATPTSPGDPPWAFSNGFNLISDASCNLFGPGDLQGTADPRLNPVLWPNGGTTPTLALLPGSDAIDAGFDFIDGFPYFVTTDQRGIPRPQGVHYDIGAYEYMGDMTPPVVTPPANLVGVEATGPDGRSAGQPPISMPFLNGATAEDDVDGPINPTEILNDVTEPFFPLGTTTVEFSAEDSSGNVGTATATVEVVDTTPPVITVPIDIPIPATSPDGKAYVDYSG